jgi:hypothetical protein
MNSSVRKNQYIQGLEGMEMHNQILTKEEAINVAIRWTEEYGFAAIVFFDGVEYKIMDETQYNDEKTYVCRVCTGVVC